MKKVLFLSFFTVIGFYGSGQGIVKTTSLWSNLVTLEPAGQLMTEKIRFTTDTTINLVTYKVVERTLDQVSWISYGFIREDANLRVYYKHYASDNEKLLYDLHLTLNDSVLAFGVHTFNSTFYLDSAMYHVTAVDSMLIGSTYQKRLHLSIRLDGSLVEAEQWIKTMGSMSGMLHNFNLKVGDDGYTLLCYEDNEFLKYHNPAYTACYVNTVGIEVLSNTDLTISLSPNPVSDKLMLTRNNNTCGDIMIYDGSGKVYFREDNFGGNIIDVSRFPAGIYILRYSDSHSYTLKKFIVSR